MLNQVPDVLTQACKLLRNCMPRKVVISSRAFFVPFYENQDHTPAREIRWANSSNETKENEKIAKGEEEEEEEERKKMKE